jgi:hypothetical protein
VNQTEIRSVLTMLTTAWPHADLPDETLRTWSQMLAVLPYQPALAAADAVIRSDNFFPSIARFREAFGSQRRGQSSDWVASTSCPLCRGLCTIKDQQGRDWLCRCANYERRPRVHNATTAPPAELLEATRKVLKKAP